MWISRRLEPTLRALLDANAAVALLGPRQVGKTTLARRLLDAWSAPTTYLDLERPADLRRLDDADAYLRNHSGHLIILDEVHRMPQLFGVLRGVIDDNRRAGFRTGQFLLLGSASLDLITMTSETLAGRIAHLELGGLAIDEAQRAGIGQDTLWFRGGFPESLTAESDQQSSQWRRDLIRTYLERDVPMFAPRVPAATLRRLWTMLAHSSAGLFNASRLAESLAVSGPTVSRYVDLLIDLGLVRRLDSWHVNTGKRMTRSPKLLVRDTGLLHALLDLDSLDAVLGHPSAGASFETFAIENLIAAAGPDHQPHHYRTARGDEIDLVLVRGGRPVVAAEVKRSTAPTVSAGFRRAVSDVRADATYLVHPGSGDPYRSGDAEVIGLHDLVSRLRG